LFGQGGDDRLYGDAGHDYLEGGADDDNLDGGEGDDWLIGDFSLNLGPVFQRAPVVLQTLSLAVGAGLGAVDGRHLAPLATYVVEGDWCHGCDDRDKWVELKPLFDPEAYEALAGTELPSGAITLSEALDGAVLAPQRKKEAKKDPLYTDAGHDRLWGGPGFNLKARDWARPASVRKGFEKLYRREIQALRLSLKSKGHKIDFFTSETGTPWEAAWVRDFITTLTFADPWNPGQTIEVYVPNREIDDPYDIPRIESQHWRWGR
jgi:Ca2+-binding RTX toxin-like protein